MKTKPSLLTFLLTACAVLATPLAQAASYYWDIDDVTAGAGGASPSGNWTTAGSTWSTSSNGTASVTAYTTTAADDLIFSAGTNATGNTVITVDTAENAKSLTVQEGALFIGGTGSITLGGTANINVSNNLTATAVNSATLGNTGPLTIAGTAGVTKTGVGTLVFNGSAVNTFTSGLNVNGGTLELRFANLATPTDLINSGNTLALGGGNLSVISNATGTTSQTLGNVTVNSGGGSLLVNPNNGTDTAITLGSITATAQGGSFVVGRALSAGTGTLALTTTTDKDATGIYGGRVIFANGTASTGYDWATTVDVASPYSLSAYAGYTALDTATVGNVTDTNNSRITAGAVIPATSNRTTNSLKFENPATAQTLDLGAGNTLALSNGGLLFSGAGVAQGPRISNGSITAGNGSGSYDLVVHQYNISSSIAIGVIGSGINNNTAINANIVNNDPLGVNNPVTLVKNGPGGLVVGGANTFTGGIVINQGNVAFNSATAINNNAITFNANSTVHTFGGSTTSGNITLNNGSQVTILNNNSSFTVTGNVLSTSGGGISLANGGQGAITLNLNGTGNTFTGPIRFTANNGTQPATLNVASLVDTDTLGAGNITFGAGSASPTGNNFGLATTATAPLTLSNRHFEMAGDLVLHTINNNSSQAFTINSDLRVIGTRAKNLTFGGSGAGTTTFDGVIANNAAPTAPGTVPIAIRTTAAVAAGGAITLGSVEGIVPGATISGTGIAGSTTIATVNPFNRTVTLSLATTGGIGIGTNLTIPNVVNSISVTKTGTNTLVLSGENSYTGATLISAGTLETNKLADTGSDSSIGRGSATTSNVFFGSGATLRYTGSTASITNRGLTYTANANNSGFTLDASGTGSGTVEFSNTAAIANTTNNQGRYLNLIGNNAGNNILAAQINNNGTSTDNTNIIKSGIGKWVLTNASSAFTGGTFINNGTVSTNSIKDSGTASPIGAGLRFTLGNTNDSGILEYTGGGDTSNRETRVGTPSTLPGTGGGSILNNGSGALIFTATTFNISQTSIINTRTLTLGGSYTAMANEIQGVIQDNTALTGLVNLEKTGPGSWTLSGNNSYTGSTSITAGTLALSFTGSITTSASVSIGAAGTLNTSAQATFAIPTTQPVAFGIDASAAGTSGKIVAAALDITNANVTYNITGTPDDAVYVLATYTSLVGANFATVPAAPTGYVLDYDYEGNKIALVQTGGDMTPPTLTSITDNVSGGPINIGATVTYTVTFSEDIDDASVTAVDFDNDGSAGITVGAISETTPTSGVFTVAVTATSPGSLKIRIPTGAVIEDVALNDLVVPVVDDTTITVRNAYQTWALTNAISSAPGADKDGDGVNNAIEFLLGGDVATNDLSKLPEVTTTATEMIITFERKRSSIDGITGCEIEVGTTLTGWPTSYTVGTTTANSDSGVTVGEISAAGFETITLTVPIGADPKKFARLNANVTE